MLRAWGSRPVRDVAAFLHRAGVDGEGNRRSAGRGWCSWSIVLQLAGVSIHARLSSALGFNEDEHGQRVFDGMFNWVGGASGGFFNYRFAQPGRNHWQHTGRWYPERQFPFTNQILFDPITGKTDGRLRQCRSTKTCPKIFEIELGERSWTKSGSLLHTDTLGNDLRRIRRNVRM